MDSLDFVAIFAAAPGPLLVLAPTADYTILAANDAYLAATLTRREQLIGQKLFDAFPDNPADPTATGVRNLRLSLEHVLRMAQPHAMAIQRYDIRRPDGTFEQHHWAPINTPVFEQDGRGIAAILHHVQDVTEFVRLKSSSAELGQVLRKESQRADDADRQLLDVERQLRASHRRHAEFEERIRAETALRDSEARFRALTMATSDVLYRMSADWAVMQPLDGRSLVASNSAPISDWLERNIPRSEHDSIRAAFTHAIETRGTFELEHRVFRPDGTIGWTFSRAVPILDDDGQLLEWFGAASDITERKHIEDQLRTSEERLALAVNAAEIGTFYCPLPPGEIVWNDKCKEHFWLPPEARIDFDLFYSILHPDDRDRVRRAVDRAIFDREPYDIEYRTLAPDGRQRWVRAMGKAYPDASGQAVRFDGVTVDVTELKRLADELRQTAEERGHLLEAERIARGEAERASRMKDEFLATLSHELRTPLNAILGWAKILEDGSAAAEDFRQGLETIARNARAQTQIIEDLLDMSRIVSGKVRLDVQRVDLAVVVQAAIDTLRPSADAKGIRFQAVLDPHAGPVSGDPSRLQQVFWNLLSNAVKFTAKGGRVQVLLHRVNSHLEVSVSDTGEGIAPDFLPHVFDRFRQADASTTRRHGGLGLGLAIVKQLVELHGGTVDAKSDGPGRGASFCVSLPLAPLRTDDAHFDRRHPTSDHDGAQRPQSPTLAGVSVLVVDDEPDSRTLVKRLLEQSSAIAAIAGSVEQAMELLDGGHRFDVIVSDIGMPERDGFDFIQSIRKRPASAGGKTPAIALTAYARSDDRTRAILAGFDMHVAKPVEPSELCAVVARLAGKAG